MAFSKPILLNMEEIVTRYVDLNDFRQSEDGYFDKIDWSRVESTLAGEPVYSLDEDRASGSFSSQSQTLKNASSSEQQLQMEESVMSSNKWCVQVHGGVRPGAAPVLLQLPVELDGHGLPETVLLTNAEAVGTEAKWKVSTKVTVPKGKSAKAHISGSELRLKGSFYQKTRLTGLLLVRRYNDRGVFESVVEVPVDELIDVAVGDKFGIEFVKDGIEYMLQGRCEFRASTDSVIELDTFKDL